MSDYFDGTYSIAEIAEAQDRNIDIEAELTGCEKEVARLEAENQDLRNRLNNPAILIPHAQIIRALIEPGSELEHRWRDNAKFKASVETIARLLPAWVHGLAAAATDQNETIRRMTQEAMRTMAPGFTYDPTTGDITNREPQ